MMPYIDRNPSGRIIGIYANKQRDNQEFVESAELPTPVPNSVTMRQARLALLNTGKLQAVNTAVNAMNGIEGAAAQIEWEFSSEVHRNRPLVLSLAPVLGMTSQDLDDLFIAASQL